jgi:NADPH:quinone reductase-like Zn-dependent oxidoreductase
MPDKTMRAIRYHEHGSAEVLRLEQVPIPDPKEGEVLVRVRVAGVNPVDWKMRRGSNPNLPATPGIDLSGSVERAGAGVTGFAPGQEVWGTGQGSYAEYAIAPASSLVPKPAKLSFEDAASIGVGARTAWAALFASAGLEAGQTVLVQGAAGGVGMWGVQFAKWKGAKVIGTCSTGNVDFVRGLGADVVVDYTKTRVETVARDVDVVLDTVGGTVQEQSWQTLKKGGILVTIVGAPDEKLAEKHGVRAARVARPANSIEIFSKVNELVTAGRAKAHVYRAFPLEQARQAHELSETTHGRGHIVLRVGG